MTLQNFKGGKLLVYFYPQADTPGCVAQSCAVRDAGPQLAGFGVAAVGISPDAPPALQRFDAKYRLGFPLLADEDHQVAEAYGVWGEKKAQGKSIPGIVRSAFLIGEDGTIVESWYRASPSDTIPQLLARLGAQGGSGAFFPAPGKESGG